MIETERLVLRKPEQTDLAAWTAFFTSGRAGFVGGGQGKEDLAWRVFAIFLGHWFLNRTGPYVFCLKDTGESIGSAGPWYPRGWPEKELTWAIWSADHEGKGLAREAVLALRAHVLGGLQWSRAVSYIAPENTASIRLAERIGCKLDANATPPDNDLTKVYVHPSSP